MSSNELARVNSEDFSPELRAAIALVKGVEEDKKRQAQVRRKAVIALCVAVVTGAIDLYVLTYVWSFTHSFHFLERWVTGGMACMMIAAVAVTIFFGAMYKDEDPTSEVLVSGFFYFVTVMTVLPFLPALIAIGAIGYYFLEGEEGEIKQSGNKKILPSVCVRDRRFEDFRGLVEHIEAWNRALEWAKQLNLRVEHNVLEGGDRARAIDLLESLEQDQQFLTKRIAYCAALARQGDLGTCATQDATGVDLIADLSERVEEFHKRIERLRELDRRAIAAAEVHRLGKN